MPGSTISLLAGAMLLLTVAHLHTAVCAAWTPEDQATLPDVLDVAISSTGASAYVLRSTTRAGQKLATDTQLWFSPDPTSTPSSSLCSGCGSPAFNRDGTLLAAIGANGGVLVYSLQGSGPPDPPHELELPPNTAALPPLRFAKHSANGLLLAVQPAAAAPVDPTAPRVVDGDILIDVITNAPVAQPNYFVLFADASIATGNSSNNSSRKSYRNLPGSVGMPGWQVSCWPYASDFDWHPDGSRVAFTFLPSTLANDWVGVGVAELDLGTGEATVVARQAAFQPAYNPTGTLLVFTVNDTSDYVWAQTWRVCFVVSGQSGGPVTCDNTGGTPDGMPKLLGFVQDSGLLYLEQNRTRSALAVMDVRHGFATAPVRITSGLPGNHSSGVIGGGFRATSAPSLALLPASRAAATAAAAGPSAAAQTDAPIWLGLTVEGFDFVQQAYRGVLKAESPDSYALTLVQLSHIESGLPAAQTPIHQIVSWASDDGRQVEGLLVLPSSSGSRTRRSAPLPLILFTHCGPAMAQLESYVGYGSVCARFPLAGLAEQGFAVLAPNYRGSSGYGRTFRRLDQHDWGGLDFADVFSGAHFLARQGIADASRIFHMGWSYGGYMGALALGAAQTRQGINLKAVVAGGSLVDLIAHTGTTDISKIIRSWAGGYHWDSPALRQQMLANSGIFHVENATAPTLLLHGAHDPRMPVLHAFQLHYALRSRNVPTRFVAYPGSGHIPGDPNQLVSVWNETLSWFRTHA